jgi:hypothetical protein
LLRRFGEVFVRTRFAASAYPRYPYTSTIWNAERIADRAFVGSEHFVGDDLVLDVVESSSLTPYHAKSVALANALSVPLVTADKAVLKAFPDRALTMKAFVGQ